MKAIETRYDGKRFRSRIEARWAVFFNRMGIEYDYEPEGFELAENCRYLPDFLLKDPEGGNLWVEIKGACPKIEELVKIMILSKESDIPFVLFFNGLERIRYVDINNFSFFHRADLGIEIEKNNDIFSLNDEGELHDYFLSKGIGASSCPLRALQDAKSARFEHGEKP